MTRASSPARRTEGRRASAQRPVLPLWAAVLAAAAAGLLMDCAFPALGWWFCAFPAIGLLLLALIGRSLGGAFLVGLSYGAVLFFLLVSWTARYLGPVPWFALAGLEALLTAILVIPLTLAYRWMNPWRHRGSVRLLALPALVAALWILREQILGTWPYGGFPWARIAMTQSESPFAATTSWVGVTGLGFLMVFLVALGIEAWRLHSEGRLRRLLIPLGVTVLIMLLPLSSTTPAGSLRVAAVQGNGPTGYFDTREPYAVIEAQVAAGAVVNEPVDLVIWPEGALDASPLTNDRIARTLSRVVAESDAPVLANAATERDGNIYNTSLLWTRESLADPSTLQLHDKRHPVPFGEHVPDREFFRALVPDLVDLIQREYSAGENPPQVTVDGATIGLAICFDVIYDDVIQESIDGGAEILVFQTNNADFRDTDENLQQLAFARMRAIETGRSVVNVSTVGTSQIIRPDGSTAAALPTDTAGVLVENVELRQGKTAAMSIGGGLSAVTPWLALIGLIVTGLAYSWHRRREH